MGVMFTLGRVKAIGPGFHLYWPPIQRPVVHPVIRDTINLEAQTLPHDTKEAIGLTISVTVVFTIDDIVKALAHTYDFNVTIRDRAQEGVVESVIGKDVETLIRKFRSINNSLTKKIREDLEPFGVNVERAFMSDFHLTNMHRVIGSTAVMPLHEYPAEEQEEE